MNRSRQSRGIGRATLATRPSGATSAARPADQMQPLNQTPHTLTPPQTLNGLVWIEALIPKMWLQPDHPQLQPPR